MAAEAERLQLRPLDGNDKTRLTLTGLLMEGLGCQKSQFPTLALTASIAMAIYFGGSRGVRRQQAYSC